MRTALALLLFFTVLWTVHGVGGECPKVKLVHRRIKTATNKELDLHLRLQNGGLASYTNYYLAMSIPQGVKYLRSAVKIAKANAPRISPTVTDEVILWRFPKLPSRARVKVSTIFKVDQYCVPDGMLVVDISAYQVVNTSVVCRTTVSQAVRAICCRDVDNWCDCQEIKAVSYKVFTHHSVIPCP
jgi:hypothetical protein